MHINAREDKMEHIELFGKPALFTTLRIDRSTIPPGWYCYDLRGSERDPGVPATLEDRVAVNQTGTILAPTALKKPDTECRRIRSKINFLCKDLSLSQFCEKHGIAFPAERRKHLPRPASPEEAGIFFALNPEQDTELGTVGHVRMDFGKSGAEFWPTWWPRDNHKLDTPEFKSELGEVIDELRERGPLKDLSAMMRYCYDHGGAIDGGWRQNYGYIVETENYRFCLRCSPGQGDYHAYLTCYDLRVQRMNMAEESAPTQDMTMGGM